MVVGGEFVVGRRFQYRKEIGGAGMTGDGDHGQQQLNSGSSSSLQQEGSATDAIARACIVTMVESGETPAMHAPCIVTIAGISPDVPPGEEPEISVTMPDGSIRETTVSHLFPIAAGDRPPPVEIPPGYYSTSESQSESSSSSSSIDTGRNFRADRGRSPGISATRVGDSPSLPHLLVTPPSPAVQIEFVSSSGSESSSSEEESEDDGARDEAAVAGAVTGRLGGTGWRGQLSRFGAAGRGVANLFGQFVELPPLSRAWVGILLVTTAICWAWPATKELLALHWKSVTKRGEIWRLVTTFSAFGGDSFSMGTLLSLWFVKDGAVVYERLQQLGSRTSNPAFGFLSAVVIGATLLLASQWFGVQGGLYKAAGFTFLSRSFWLSHDLSFLLFCLTCWELPLIPVELGLVPGIGPFKRYDDMPPL